MDRQTKHAARREAILAAALKEFSSKGFAAARMEDIARAARVAKGTLYLYFEDKAGLFTGLINAYMAPVHRRAATILADDSLSLRDKIRSIAAPFLADNGNSTVADIIRLLHSEGRNNPKLAESYINLILEPVLTLHQEHLRTQSAVPVHPALIRFPQLLLGPLIQGLVWQGLFGTISPLDINAMFEAYLDIILPHADPPPMG